jgi:NAD(P)H-dependent flavin oxidoreductase YrpB (nitropropane dioxygenase family)
MGCHNLSVEQVHEAAGAIRQRTDRNFALNFLIFDTVEACFAAALEEKPPTMAFAWPRPGQDLKSYVGRAHDIGATVTFMAGGVPEAKAAADAGADVIIAQGTEAGGHVSWNATMALVPVVVDAVGPVPVVAAGGIADGRGMAAALALGAEGVLLGTRFLASNESPLHQNFKQAIVDADGHNTVLTEIPDICQAKVWPGAMSRALRNKFIERWAGREWALRQNQVAVMATMMEARKKGDIEEAGISMGQDSGLINEVLPAGDIVGRIVEEAEDILSNRLPGLLR